MHYKSLLIKKKKLAYVLLPQGYYKLFTGSALGLSQSFHYMKLAGGANKRWEQGGTAIAMPLSAS